MSVTVTVLNTVQKVLYPSEGALSPSLHQASVLKQAKEPPPAGVDPLSRAKHPVSTPTLRPTIPPPPLLLARRAVLLAPPWMRETKKPRLVPATLASMISMMGQ